MNYARIIFLMALAGSLSACDDPQTAKRALDDAGYTDIQAGGYDWLRCGQDDDFATQFTAVNPAGKRVSGVVCSSWIGKGATIRF